MAWTNPRTWNIGEVVTAAMMNTHVRDNLNWILPVPGSWTTYTPTFTTTGTAQDVWNNVTGRYFQTGKLVVCLISATSTVGGGNYGTGTYLLSLPVSAATFFYTGNVRILDSSTGLIFLVHSMYNSATTISMYSGDPGDRGVVTQGRPLSFSTSDTITVTHIYEAA